MSKKNLLRPAIEALEARIAPAAVAALPTIKDAELAYDLSPSTDAHFVHAVTGTPILVKAGQVLTTGSGARSGTYLMFVQKGQALIFTTDLNNNGQVDYNEITGVAAGDGLRLTSFVDIHGDIVTNLDADRSLSDSDNNAANNPVTDGDGRVLNNTSIESITFRSLALTDLTDQTHDPVPTVDQADLQLRFAFTSYSLFGQILVGKNFGVAGDPTSGLHIDDSGKTIQKIIYDQSGIFYYVPSKPTVGAIRTGTAANGESFSFGYSRDVDIQGDLTTFTTPSGQIGGDISYVVANGIYNFSGAYSGDGGLGARGGNISNVAINGDDASGYNIIAGNGGRGTAGGGGGAILNFSDAGSVTGAVHLQTGTGGQGTNGVGGAGGSFGVGMVTVNTSTGVSETANLNVNGGVSINLGDGGTGFKGGGAGASLTNLILRSPDDLAVNANLLVATTHDHAHDPKTGLLTGNAVIGEANGFDFDNDGFNDIVYTTSGPEQLIVAFGDGTGDFSSRAPLQLDGPAHVTAMAVADIDGDGHPDLVVGSSKAGDFSGITTFLAKYHNNNGTAVFDGFSSPRISPLPSLNSGNSNADPSNFGYRNTTNPITSLAIGDFDGDGRNDVAVTAGYVTSGIIGGSATGNPAYLEQVLVIMSPDVENGFSDGHFYADMGAKAANGSAAVTYLPFKSLGIGPNAQVEATALNTLADHDVVATVRIPGSLAVGAVSSVDPFPGMPPDNSALRVFNLTEKVSGPTELTKVQFGQIDANRALVGMTLSYATVKQFAILDMNQDGNADYVALTDVPAGYLVGFMGDGKNSGQVALSNPASMDNSGYFIGAAPVSLRASVPTLQGSMSGVAVESAGGLTTYTFQDQGTVVVNPGVDTTKTFASAAGSLNPLYTEAYDTFIPLAGPVKTGDLFLYAFADDFFLPASVQITDGSSVGHLPSDPPVPSIRGGSIDLVQHSFGVTAGDGGNGVIGKGGNGGAIGSGTLTDTGARVEGSVDITLPVKTGTGVNNIAYSFRGGRGGDGFSSGGNGGSVAGVVARANPDSTLVGGSVSLYGGNGGIGNSGAGGAGGSLLKLSVFQSNNIFAGNGGDGLTGGNGGSILGNGFSIYSDLSSSYQFVFAGDGGDGIKKGGNGGSVANFHGEFSTPGIGFVDGGLGYTGGNGGSAVSGVGGAGGDVSNVSPFSGGANLLAGDIVLFAGRGGDGTTGGRGGNIATFVNNESGSTPGLLVFFAGPGGDGSRGNGGAGGNVSGLSVSSIGIHNPQTGDPLTAYSYNHIIAGNGGSSASAVGGAGGSVVSVNTNASDGTFAVAAGSGGEGLLVGGAGGSVKTVSLAVGGSSGKGLVVAGVGGSAGGVLGDGTGSSTGLGGKIGKGGAGGNIADFRQSGGIGSHFDLIAGNGGDSLNFGTLAGKVGAKYVGKGGSISKVNIVGNLGNTDSNVAIKSYNNVVTGETMANFVDRVLFQPTDAAEIDDSQGNVGVVVGASGRLKSIFVGYDAAHEAVFRSIAAFGAVNGDLINVRAKQVLSAVAGNVERIASIHAVRDLLDSTPLMPGEKAHAPYVGTNKNPDLVVQYRADTFDGKLPDPLNPNDPTKRFFPSEPLIDGGLIDGALVSSTAPKMTVGGRLVDLSFVSVDPNVSLSHRFVKS